MSYFITAAPMIISLFPVDDIMIRSDFTISCIATADPVYKIKWLKDGIVLPRSTKYLDSEVVEIFEREFEWIANLTVYDVDLSDDGNYTCFVFNIHGNDNSEIEIQIMGTG